MKKVVFVIQVFCLLAMFPLYIIAELNHTKGIITINKSPSNIKKEAWEKNTQFTLNTTVENSDVVLFMFKGITCKKN